MADITIRTFNIAVTPPVGDYTCGGLHGKRATGVESPLSLRGMIFDQDDRRYVIASVEFCYLCGRSHDRMIAALAESAATSADRVTLHSVHTHDAPLIYEEAHALYEDVQPGVHNESYFSSVIERTQQAIATSLQDDGVAAAGISFTQYPVFQFASTRRVLDEHNQCHVRWSICTDQQIRSAPEGKIDQMLDQIVLYRADGQPFAAMHFYACHPQVSDGRALWSGDTVGVALDTFDKNHPDVLSMYFNGCGGDITAGKYSTPDKARNRIAFGLRLYDAMASAYELAKPVPLDRINWRNATFDMPTRDEEQDTAAFETAMRAPDSASNVRYLSAIKLHKLRNKIETYPFRTSRLTLGDADILFMPAELVIDYQLYAKSIKPRHLACAAYGDSSLNYVATDEAFDQGGYEVQPGWTEVDRGCEALIKQAIDGMLAGE